MAGCGQCGTEISDQASRCPRCGAITDASIDVLDPFAESVGGEFVTAEGQSSRGPVLVAVLAILGLIGFFVVLGGDDDAEPAANDSDDPFVDNATDEDPAETTDETTTTPTDEESPDEPVVLNQLEFVPVDADFGTGIVGAHALDGETYVITSIESDGPSPWFPSHGIRVHRRGADGTWVDLGPTLPDVEITATATGPGELLAVGRDLDGRPSLWTSADGATWTAEQLPEFETGDDEAIVPNEVAAIEGVVIVRGTPQEPYIEFLADLREADIDLDGSFGWDIDGNDIMTVRGPFGVPVQTIDLAGLGIENPENQPFDIEGGVAWIKSVAGWATETEEYYPGQIGVFAGVDGELIRVSNGTVSTTRDGIEWTSIRQSIDGWQAAVWGDQYVTITGADGINLISADFSERLWKPLPASRDSSVADLHAGPAGIAVTRWLFADRTDDRELRTLIARDDVVLEFDASGQLELRVEGTIVDSFELGSQELDDNVMVDSDAATMTFFDPQSAEPLITITFDELLAAAESLSIGWAPDHELLFSRDARGWTVNAVADLTGPSSTLADIFIGDDHVIVFVWESINNIGFGQGEIRAFTAPVPALDATDNADQ